MVIFTILGWWYSQGWLSVIEKTGEQLNVVSRTFAVSQLLKTWFAPWKQIYTPSSFMTFFSSLVDNTISRFIGFCVRTAILFCALLMAVLVVLFGLFVLAIWPLLPMGIFILPILTVSGVSL